MIIITPIHGTLIKLKNNANSKWELKNLRVVTAISSRYDASMYALMARKIELRYCLQHLMSLKSILMIVKRIWQKKHLNLYNNYLKKCKWII